MTQTQKDKIQHTTAVIFRNLLKIFWIFPIKTNRVVCVSYAGKQYSCNPKYISMYLEKNYPDKFDIAFALKEPKKWSGNGERFIKFLSLRNLYDFCTAKVLISNGGMPMYIPKRKGQYVINTWHGGGAYKLSSRAGNIENDTITKDRLALNLYKSHCTNLFLSSSETFTQIAICDLVPEYHGEVMPCGMPRNDIFFKENQFAIRKKVCKKLNIDSNCKVVLYAPTFRGSMDTMKMQASEVFQLGLDVDALMTAIYKRYRKKSIILFRAHYGMVVAPNTQLGKVLNVSDYEDVQELLCAADILISDYSSIIWDYSLTKKLCLLFVPDMDYYLYKDLGTCTPLETWPGIICRSNEELTQAVLSFDETEYIKKVEKHHKDLGSYETGTACEQVCRRIAQVCGIEG